MNDSVPNLNEIDNFGMKTADAISTLIAAGHYQQALVLLYSAIDTLAWAKKEHGDVNRGDFVRWSEEYIRPEETVGATSIDLYAARCSMLHSHSTESRLSNNGDAKPIWYVTAPATVAELEFYAEQLGVDVRVIHVSVLIGAFYEAVMKFSDEFSENEQLATRCKQRMRKWLHFTPAAAIR